MLTLTEWLIRISTEPEIGGLEAARIGSLVASQGLLTILRLPVAFRLSSPLTLELT